MLYSLWKDVVTDILTLLYKEASFMECITEETPTSTRLTVAQAAEFAGRHPETIRRWIRRGLLPAYKVGVKGRFSIDRQELEETMRYRPTNGEAP